jgi:hypothetical protein
VTLHAFLVSGFWFLAFGFWLLVSGFWFLVSGSGFWFGLKNQSGALATRLAL